MLMPLDVLAKNACSICPSIFQKAGKLCSQTWLFLRLPCASYAGSLQRANCQPWDYLQRAFRFKEYDRRASTVIGADLEERFSRKCQRASATGLGPSTWVVRRAAMRAPAGATGRAGEGPPPQSTIVLAG